MEFTMYDTLLQLPLFQGLGKNCITDILSKVKFHFKKHQPGETVIKQGDECLHVCFLFNGSLLAETLGRDNRYTFYERMTIPGMIEPYSLFGLRPRYHSSYVAETEVSTLSIEKQALLDVLLQYEACKYNFANTVCCRGQYLYQRIWSDYAGDLRVRFISFLLLRSQRLAGYKRLRVKMEDLAYLLNDCRLNVSKMLNGLSGDGLVNLRRKEIEIPALEKLLPLLD